MVYLSLTPLPKVMNRENSSELIKRDFIPVFSLLSLSPQGFLNLHSSEANARDMEAEICDVSWLESSLSAAPTLTCSPAIVILLKEIAILPVQRTDFLLSS